MIKTGPELSALTRGMRAKYVRRRRIAKLRDMIINTLLFAGILTGVIYVTLEFYWRF